MTAPINYQCVKIWQLHKNNSSGENKLKKDMNVFRKGGHKMRAKRGSIVSKQDFIQDGLYAKEEYEGLLVSSDEQQNCYNLGVQLAEDSVLFVDQATDSNINEKLETWVPQIQTLQRQHNVTNNSGNYTK
jgi:hypothetical protein